jgi:hypothetical protein
MVKKVAWLYIANQRLAGQPDSPSSELDGVLFSLLSLLAVNLLHHPASRMGSTSTTAKPGSRENDARIRSQSESCNFAESGKSRESAIPLDSRNLRLLAADRARPAAAGR